jgi:hypothetical protein
MRRRRGPRRPPVVPGEGDLVVDARIRARLLGLHLLDLDARVIARTAGEETRGASTAIPADSTDTTGTTQITDRVQRPARPVGDDVGALGRPALSRAAQLLDEGSSALGDARRVRRQVGVRADGAAPPVRASRRRRAAPAR